MNEHELRPIWSAYLAYVLILGLPISIFVVGIRVNQEPWAYIGASILGTTLLVTFYWLRVCRLLLTDQTLEYRSIFGRSIILAIADVRSATFEFEYKWGQTLVGGFLTSIHSIVIVGNHEGKEIEIVLPARIFEGRKAGEFLKQINGKIKDGNGSTRDVA